MRSRNIKPSFFSNEQLAEVSPEARLLFIGLWCMADREGRLEDRPKRIKMSIFPADSYNCEPFLAELADQRLIVRYQIDGQRYIEIPRFTAHQSPHHKEKPSCIPPRAPDSAVMYEVEAPDSTAMDGTKVSDKSQDNPGGTPCEPGKGLCQPPLNPDSRILNPESGIPSLRSGGDARERARDPTPAQAVDAWNDMAERAGLPRVQRLTKAREAKLNQRLTECGGLDGWRTACAQVEASAFLTGSNDRGWKADFDFLCQQRSFTKLMEGGYASGAPPPEGEALSRYNAEQSAQALEILEHLDAKRSHDD